MLAYDAYYDELNRRLGSSFPECSYERNACWPEFVKLGLICSARGWDPAHYVGFVLGSSGRDANAPTPKDLVAPRILGSYDPAKRDGMRNIRDEYMKCVELLVSSECDDGSDEKDILISPMSPFPAWFRLFYPETTDVEIADAWGPVAKDELSSTPAIVEFLDGIDHSKWERVRRLLWAYGPIRDKGGKEAKMP